MRGAITRCGFRDPIRRSRSAFPMHATIVIARRTPNGRRRRCSAGTDSPPPVSRRSHRRSLQPRKANRARPPRSRRLRTTSGSRRSPAPRRLNGLRLCSTRRSPTPRAAARKLDPTFAPAYVNAADAFRAAGKEAAARDTLKDGIAMMPDSAVLHHSLGLSYARQQQSADALRELERAVALAPDQSQYVYVYA